MPANAFRRRLFGGFRFHLFFIDNAQKTRKKPTLKRIFFNVLYGSSQPLVNFGAPSTKKSPFSGYIAVNGCSGRFRVGRGVSGGFGSVCLSKKRQTKKSFAVATDFLPNFLTVFY